MKKLSVLLVLIFNINLLSITAAGAEYITRAEAARLVYDMTHMEYDYIPERLIIQKTSNFSDIEQDDEDYNIVNEMSAVGLFESTGCSDKFCKDMYVTEGFAGTMLANVYKYQRGTDTGCPFSYGTDSNNITKAEFEQMLVTLYNSLKTVKVSEVPEGAERSDMYTVTVNGESTGVYKTFTFADGDIKTGEIMGRPVTEVAAAYFDFFGTVTVEITSNLENISSENLKIRPLSLNINPNVSGNKITFELDRPCNISIEPYGTLKPLHLFANPIDKRLPDFNGDNVIYYGAGVHYINPTALTDNTTVYIDSGAVVYLNPQENTTPGDPVYGHEMSFTDASFNAVRGNYANIGRIKNVTIRGRGIISGSNTLNYSQRHKLIELYGVENAIVDGVMLLESSGWTLAVFHSDGVYINNVKIIGHYANNDGIDFCDSKNGIVENCFAHNADDSFLIKAWYEVSNVTFRRCVAWNDVSTSFGAVCELYEPITDILYEDCTVIHSTLACWTNDSGGVIGIWNCGGSSIDRFKFNNIVIEDCVSGKEPIKINVADSVTESYLIQNVTFSNINILNSADTRIAVKGPLEHGIKNISFQNITMNVTAINDASGFIIKNADNITVSDKVIKYFTENLAFNAKASVYNSSGQMIEGGHEAHPQRASLSAINNYDIDAASGWYAYITPIAELPVFVELDYYPKVASISSVTIGSKSKDYGITCFEIERFDGEEWTAVTPSAVQSDGITVNGNTINVNLNKPSRTEQNSGGTRTQYFYDVNLGEACRCIKLRLKIVQAKGSGAHWGMLPIDELLTYGYSADSSDASAYDNYDSMIEYMTEVFLKNGDKDAEKRLLGYAEQINDPVIRRRVLWKIENTVPGVENIAPYAVVTATACSSDAYKLTDKKYDSGWSSATTEAGAVLVLDFKRPVVLYDLSFVQRYYPDCVTDVTVCAETGGVRRTVLENAKLNHTNVPELAWYSGGYTPLESEAYAYYEKYNLLRADKGEINCYDMQKLYFEAPLFCDKIFITVNKANTVWGSYGIREIEATGCFADEFIPYNTAFYRDGQMITAAADGTISARFDLITPGGKFFAVLKSEKDNRITNISVKQFNSDDAAVLKNCSLDIDCTSGDKLTLIFLSDIENVIPVGAGVVLE